MNWTTIRVYRWAAISKGTFYAWSRAKKLPFLQTPYTERDCYMLLRYLHGGLADIHLRRRYATRLLVYTSDNCKGCKTLKNWLNKGKYNYEERNINRDPGAMYDLNKLGAMQVPVMVIGKEHLVGFSEPAARHFLDLFY